MIFNEDILYNRHLLSRQQIESHFGKVDVTRIGKSDEVFQNVDSFLAIADALQARNIPFIPLKGPLLSHQLHRDYTTRRFYDLDFLVGQNDLAPFFSILNGLGYSATPTLPSTPEQLARLLESSSHIVFQHGKEGTDVEIHWRALPRYKFLSDAFEKVLRENTTQYSLEGRTFHKLSNEVELLYILAHGATHAWFRLKWLVDVSDYIEKVELKMDVVCRLATEHSLLRVIGFYNAIAKDFLPNACLFPFGGERFLGFAKHYSHRKISGPPPRALGIPNFGKRVSDRLSFMLFQFCLVPDMYSFRDIIGELKISLSRILIRGEGKVGQVIKNRWPRVRSEE